jgi:hypothetical protein
VAEGETDRHLQGVGRVHVYALGASGWVQRGADIDGEAAGDWAGRASSAVSLSADGLTMAVGAHGNGGAGFRAGHVRIYNWDGSSWVQRGPDIDG